MGKKKTLLGPLKELKYLSCVNVQTGHEENFNTHFLVVILCIVLSTWEARIQKYKEHGD